MLGIVDHQIQILLVSDNGIVDYEIVANPVSLLVIFQRLLVRAIYLNYQQVFSGSMTLNQLNKLILFPLR